MRARGRYEAAFSLQVFTMSQDQVVDSLTETGEEFIRLNIHCT